ncbi:MAG TPA: alkaline phosphatase family protein [Actinomycetota bacterium]|nr:alkaline phosphatase family protein [Actinomycetota bacterium]
MTRASGALIVLLSATLGAALGAATGIPSGTGRPSPEPAGTETGTPPPSSGRYARIACSLPPKEIQRVWNGFHPERSGDIQFVPQEPNYLGNFASHSGPWDYLQRVPMFLYGPEHVPEQGEIKRPVTMADVAPTFARHLGFDFQAPDGEPLVEATLPDAPPPKLILTIVWDGAGRNVLDEYPRAWPNLARLIPEGVWYDNATVGSSPSVTPAIHSTLGTGAFPRQHGLVDLRFQVEGRVRPSAFERSTFLIEPTLGDEFDLARDNRPVVGMVGAEGTLGMIGHGTLHPGGDRDVAAAQRAGSWGLRRSNGRYYDFPEYILDVPGLDEAERVADEDDGTLDGYWLGLPLTTPDSLTLTPGFAEYQTAVIEELIQREGFGQDDVPDLLYVNYKQVDKVGHRFAFPTTEMERALESSDDALADLIRILDAEVGAGEWVLALTADHGSTPLPDTTGAIPIEYFELYRDLLAAFDGDGDERLAVQTLRITQAWIDNNELEERGHTLEEMADWFMDYTWGENALDPSVIPEGQEDEKLFAAAFPADVVEGLPCVQR